MTRPLELSKVEIAIVIDDLFSGDEVEERQDYRDSFDSDLREFGVITAIYNLGWLVGSANATSK